MILGIQQLQILELKRARLKAVMDQAMMIREVSITVSDLGTAEIIEVKKKFQLCYSQNHN